MPSWLIATLPWLAVPALLLWRGRGSVSLSSYAPRPEPADGSGLVSIVVPARNEARNIEPCLRSILTSAWHSIEVFVVDDHSTDGTRDIARRVAAGDPRVTVLEAPPLPAGWFGKQWACHTAVQRARGDILLFTDADTRHTPELLSRALAALDARRADLLSVMGTQEMKTFWERLLQPQVIGMLVARYGGAEAMSRSTRPTDKIANGQFLMIRRAAHERIGGHAAVRDHVAEDMRIAQEVCRAGLAVHFVEGREYLTTRMYDSLRALWRGWGKNVWAGGRDSLDMGPAGRALIRVVFPLPPLWQVAPALLGALALAGVLGQPVLWWAATAYAAGLLFWVAVNIDLGAPVWYAPLYPLGAAIFSALLATAAWRGDRVEWKGREYRSVPVP